MQTFWAEHTIYFIFKETIQKSSLFLKITKCVQVFPLWCLVSSLLGCSFFPFLPHQSCFFNPDFHFGHMSVFFAFRHCAWSWVMKALGFSGQQKHTLMLKICVIVDHRDRTSRQTNNSVGCEAIMTANTLSHPFLIMNLTCEVYTLCTHCAVFPIFKHHLLNAVSSCFLLMSWKQRQTYCFPFFFL